MRYSSAIHIITIVLVGLLAACGPEESTLAPATAGANADKAEPTLRGPSQEFLAGLQAAYENTEWERIEFNEVTRGGSQIAFPKAFNHGEYLQLSVNLRRGGPREVPPVEVYVPKDLQTAPGRCVIFRYEGNIEGAEYVIKTFLPVWFDELDLGDYHHTYQLETLPDGTTYTVIDPTRYDTPPTPWAHPPVKFSLLPSDPGTVQPRRNVYDPNEIGDD